MKPHPRIRKTVRWGGAVVRVRSIDRKVSRTAFAATVLGAAVSVAAVFLSFGYDGPGGQVLVGEGTLIVYRIQKYPKNDMAWGVMPGGGVSATFDWYEWPNGDWKLSLPVWIPAAAFGVIAAIARSCELPSRRRAKLNLCSKCNYDRTGLLKDSKCPECGAAAVGV